MTLRTYAPHVEVTLTIQNQRRLACLARVWQRSWLYSTDDPQRVVLAAADMGWPDDRLIGVIGPLTNRAFMAFIAEEHST